jgi:hypothetical protein
MTREKQLESDLRTVVYYRDQAFGLLRSYRAAVLGLRSGTPIAKENFAKIDKEAEVFIQDMIPAMKRAGNKKVKLRETLAKKKLA